MTDKFPFITLLGEKMKIVNAILIVVFSLIFQNQEVLAADNIILEDSLLGIQIGSPIQTTNEKYPGLYSHKLMFGEILHEACNQEKLEVITFTEVPWSPSFITYIWVRQESDPNVCRDETGALPDLNIDIRTPKGIKLGDSKELIIEKYGRPNEEKTLDNGETIMRYFGQGTLVENMKLIFTLHDNLVSDISLGGNIPGANKPF